VATYFVHTRAGWLGGSSLTELAVLTAGALDAGASPTRWRVREADRLRCFTSEELLELFERAFNLLDAWGQMAEPAYP
jgi:hypothetical protein